MNYYMSK